MVMASSIEQLGRYANCRGSSVGNGCDFMCLITSLSKDFMTNAVSAIGQKSLRHDTDDFFGGAGDFEA